MEKINAADSRSMALKRLHSLRKNLDRFPVKKEVVFKEMEWNALVSWGLLVVFFGQAAYWYLIYRDPSEGGFYEEVKAGTDCISRSRRGCMHLLRQRGLTRPLPLETLVVLLQHLNLVAEPFLSAGLNASPAHCCHPLLSLHLHARRGQARSRWASCRV